MKKIFSLFLVVALMLSLSALAFAEEDIDIELVEYNWADAEPVFKQEFAGNSTKWYIEEVDATLWLPSAFVAEELTEEDRANDLIKIFASPNGGNFIILSYSDVENFSVFALYAVMSEAGEDVTLVSVNEIPAVLLRDNENSSLVLMFATREEKLFQVVFMPLEDEELFELIIDSIQPYVEEVEDAPAPVNPVSGLISK